MQGGIKIYAQHDTPRLNIESVERIRLMTELRTDYQLPSLQWMYDEDEITIPYFQSLERLHCSWIWLSCNPTALLNLQTLKSLKMSSPEVLLKGPCSAFDADVLHMCTCLEEVDLTVLTKFVKDDLIEHLGKTLRHFRLREGLIVYRTVDIDFETTVLSGELIQKIGQHCPKLLSLGLDIPFQRLEVL